MTPVRAAVLVSLVLAWLVPPLPAAAQDSRAAAIEEAQAEKASQVRPYEPNKAERIALQFKRSLFETPNGFFPYFDSVYSGGGFTLGGGYRQYYGDQTKWRKIFEAKRDKIPNKDEIKIGPTIGIPD